MGLWIIWLIVAIALAAAEVVTTTLAFGLVAAGALVAAIAGALGASLPWQFAAFVLASLAGLVLVRPVVMRHLRRTPSLRSGTAALVGQTAYVLADITPHSGRVRIGGEEWSARPYDELSVILAGSTVEVLQIKGAMALVHPRE
ncbi:MAG TPA: NfeD family protein [Streptosporangiaceae bacterium]|jgi:membrane protein implicated in regulation of membrane protease activity|nr:NfeD family protein [Streptosporangiaceae bacterium]